MKQDLLDRLIERYNEGADLRMADLRGANLEGANIKDTDFEGARLDPEFRRRIKALKKE